MIDFHSHILPEMDDGATSVNESEKMILSLFRQGVKYIIATPHYSSYFESPSSFIERRKVAFSELCENTSIDSKRIVSGGEIQYFDGMSACEEIRLLKIEHSDCILLEMPFYKWSNRMVNELITMQNSGFQVIIAHIERYLPFLPNDLIQFILSEGVLLQSNAAFFNGFLSSFKAMRMLKNQQIHFIGSDCHNMTTRSPEVLGKAFETVSKKLGEEKMREMDALALKLLHLE